MSLSADRRAASVAPRRGIDRAGTVAAAVASERGIALLSVLGLLAILLVLAAMIVSSSRVESALSGNAKQNARAFAAADAGLGYGLADANNFVQLGTRCTDLQEAGMPITGDVCVRYDHEGPPPPAVKVSALRFRAFHFDMDANGTAQTNAVSTLEMEAARLGPSQ